MPKITIAEPWTYRTPLATVEFSAGEHEVSDEIAAAAPQVKDTADDEPTTPRAPRRAAKVEG